MGINEGEGERGREVLTFAPGGLRWAFLWPSALGQFSGAGNSVGSEIFCLNYAAKSSPQSGNGKLDLNVRTPHLP